jgi:hypothetical protein
MHPCNSSFLPLGATARGWAVTSWTISLLSSLFLICADEEASNGRMKKWEECGWEKSWPTYFCSLISVHCIHPRLIIWFLNNLVFTWRTRVSFFVWLLPLDLSGMGVPTSSYATAGIALRVSGALKPHHHDKVRHHWWGHATLNTIFMLLLSKFVVNEVKDSHCRHGFNCKLETVLNDL